jgi:hypothetical protein
MADAASPQPHAQVVAAATGGDQQALDVGVTPAAWGLHGKPKVEQKQAAGEPRG